MKPEKIKKIVALEKNLCADVQQYANDNHNGNFTNAVREALRTYIPERRNPKGAGRKPLPYKTIVMRIPEPLEVEVKKLIEDFKNANQ